MTLKEYKYHYCRAHCLKCDGRKFFQDQCKYIGIIENTWKICKEPIDENKLDELSLEDVPNYCYEQDGDYLKDTWIEGFKAGYHKAMEESL